MGAAWRDQLERRGADGTDMPFFARYMENVEAAFERLLARR